MHRSAFLHLHPAVRRWVLWCVMAAVPVFGVSGTVVGLLGTHHVHRDGTAAHATPGADPMQGWVDFRRTAGVTTVARPHAHSHGLFARHHHDPGDASVVALDGGLLQGEAADEGGAAASLSPMMAPAMPTGLAPPPSPRAGWPVAVDTAETPWATGGPLRPPKA